MTNKQAKAYIISQRQMNLAIDNQHGIDACNKAIEAFDKIDKIDALVNHSFYDDFEMVGRIRAIINS